MAKTILGIDIGNDNLKLALVSGGAVRNAVTVPMPRNMIRDGHVVSVESMGEMIRTAMKENGLHSNLAAFAFPNETVYVKTVAMPVMNADQVLYNLPFEFKDYLTGEIREYAFDYAVYPETLRDKETGAKKMEVFAAAAPRTVLDEARQIVRKGGMKLEIAAPAICAYMQLIRRKEEKNQGSPREYCLLDLGYQTIRMYIFKGEKHVVTRELDTGLSGLDQVLADAFNVDIHLAHTYFITDYENCSRREECLAVYDSIATELMRAINFFRYSNPESTLNDIWLCGGGAKIIPLQEAIADTLDMNLHPGSDLLPNPAGIPDAEAYIQAIGITLE